MTIHVRHIDDHTVEVTLTPGWLRRLFGARPRRGIAVKDFQSRWEWKATTKRVADAIEREIECTTVEDLPRAELRVLRGGR